MQAAGLGCLILAACAGVTGNAITPGTAGGGLMLRNDSHELICYAYFSTAGAQHRGPDRLLPPEVIDPGVSRRWDLPAGRYDLRLVDCNRTVILAREAVDVGPEGVVLTFRRQE